MLYKKVKGTEVYRAIIEENGKKRVFAIFGTVKELAEREIIFLNGKKVNSNWIVLCPEKMDMNSSYELPDFDACKEYIERMC